MTGNALQCTMWWYLSIFVGQSCLCLKVCPCPSWAVCVPDSRHTSFYKGTSEVRGCLPCERRGDLLRTL